MLPAIDSYFEYVSDRMATVVNPNRKIVGLMDAMDWPPKNILMEAFYLLTLGEKPIIGKSFWSSSITTVVHTLQWTWIILGTDLTTGKIGRNRGDRYRVNMRMRQELITANYPWFCQKARWSVQGDTPSGVVLTSDPVDPPEFVWWQKSQFMNRIDRESGTVYGTATVNLVDMTEAVTV